ncbi:MAG: dienelactone hydrolase family protein [Alphaproteobacteria bacterium]|nr:dienelactone hydrolase family protein [Alphaproteobacteria bacterium]
MPGETITLKSLHDGFAFSAYHATPEGKPRGGLVLVQEIFGVTDHIRELCDGYAADGFEVLAPSLYDRQQPGFETDYSQGGIARAMKLRDGHDMALSVSDVQTCIDWLAVRGNAAVCITGYCYGGSVAWVAACRCTGLAASSGYYGRAIIDYVAEIPRCPTILHFGRADKSIPMEWVDTIAARHPGVPVYVYEAGHGFNSDRRTDYSAADAKLARERTLELFRIACR